VSRQGMRTTDRARRGQESGDRTSQTPLARLLLGLHVERSLELPNLFRSCQAHANLLISAR
jgi:hypothetical protein